MGLGLASASLICKALKGELNLIRSEENEGSKFHFTMAIKMVDPIVNGNTKKLLNDRMTYKPMMGLTRSNSSKIYQDDKNEYRVPSSQQISESVLESQEFSNKNDNIETSAYPYHESSCNS